ncbi:hypothetical protein Sango_3037000 [Sesamum angolense]|uniref:Uncharacterized protein n=1 Tax=Sesamum angolense TaxID=2727404 RepID=A0AAE1TAS7_9LAMI|nr:hypothetical protein Sango_3037000 [Sesamum angolense]
MEMNTSTSEVAKEAVWMKNYIQKLVVASSIAEPVVIFCNNSGAIAQAKESSLIIVSNTFLDTSIFLEKMVSSCDVRMDRVSSAKNTANPHTKPILQISHAQYLDKMGLTSMGDWL